MACWSSENATKAYLQARKIGKIGKEPDVGEFISALAAGNNSQLIVMACSSCIAVSITLSLVAAAHQTGGRVVYILNGLDDDDIEGSKKALGSYSNCIEFVKGDAEKLLLNDYKGADFVLIDCNIDVHNNVFRAAKESVKEYGSAAGVIVGYNALHKGSWSEFKPHFLPIGEGLLVTRIGRGRKRSRWVVTVDKCTGEEHVFRITSPSQQKVIEA